MWNMVSCLNSKLRILQTMLSSHSRQAQGAMAASHFMLINELEEVNPMAVAEAEEAILFYRLTNQYTISRIFVEKLYKEIMVAVEVLEERMAKMEEKLSFAFPVAPFCIKSKSMRTRKLWRKSKRKIL